MAKPSKRKPEAAASSPLFEAIGKRDVKQVRALLKAGGLDFSARDAEGRTPFQYAQYQRSDEIAVMLLDAGAPLEEDDLNLYWAVGTGRADVVRKLIDAGADVEMEAIGGKPLDYAASNDMAEIVQVLIDAGADIDAESEFSGTPLAQAVEKNATASALALIRAGAKLDAPRTSYGTLLTTAVARANRELALALIEAGADVNARGKVNFLGKKQDYSRDLGANATPLILAARVGDEAIVDALLTAGADVHARDEDGKTALDWAKAAKRPAIVKRLEVAAKAKPAKANLDEDLIFAASNGSVARVPELLARGAKVDARDARSTSPGHTPLMLAAARGDVKTAAALLDAGAAIDARDNDGEPVDPQTLRNIKSMISMGAEDYIGSIGAKLGRTALHLAVEAGEASVVKLLLERGADPNATDVINRTPLKLANEADDAKIADVIKAAGGKVSAPKAKAAPPPPPAAKSRSKPKPSAKVKKPKKAPPLPVPDFSAAAKSSAYEEALAEMEERCGSKRQPMHDLPGVFTFHVHSSKAKRLNLRALHEEFLKRGFYAFSTGATADSQLALAPTKDKYALIAAFQTNGANYGLGPEDIARWLRELEEEVPFILTGIGWDFVKGHFTAPRPDPRDLAERMYEFCPDIVDQGVGDVDLLAEHLAESDDLFFWWD